MKKFIEKFKINLSIQLLNEWLELEAISSTKGSLPKQTVNGGRQFHCQKFPVL